MQHLDNDMEELFKKAGSDYPLKTDPGNWDAVHGRLQQPDGTDIPLNPKPNNRKYYWLLLLLLPLGYLLIDNYNEFSSKTQKEATADNGITAEKNEVTGESQQEASGRRENPDKPLYETSTPDKAVVDDHPAAGEEIKTKETKNNTQKNITHESNPGTNNNPAGLINNNSPAANNNPKDFSSKGKEGIEKEKSPRRKSSNENSLREGKNLPDENKLPHKKEQDKENMKREADRLKGQNNRSSSLFETESNLYPGGRELVYGFPQIPVSFPLSSYNIQPPPVKNNITTSNNPPETKKQTQKQIVPKFYAGLVAGPDLSTVKYQEIKNAGFNIGIIAGYKLSKRWALETGFIYNKKKYYTEGKYFDKSGANIPPSVTLEYLDGACEMFEVPISVKYNFSARENTFFATAGITSYFMMEEKYDYKAWYGGSWYNGNKSYGSSGNNLFSNMQFSIGYNYTISKNTSLKIEPYIKLPVKNIGAGNLPITSTGIYFGIMRNIR